MPADCLTAVRDPFTALKDQPADSLLSLIGLHARDPRADKIDLGVGVYRNLEGTTPVMAAVEAAEARLFETQTSKSYLGPEGDQAFCDRLKPIIFGDMMTHNPRLMGIQTPGGTGALMLIAQLLTMTAPDARIFVGTPTWPNHGPIFSTAGVEVVEHPFFDKASQSIVFDEMMTALGQARTGDAILLHGGCHNPTGAELSPPQWAAVGDLIVDKGLLPVIDLAYQGLGHGLEADAANMRALLARVPNALIAYSCDKNFGLYRERVGAIYALASTEAMAQKVRGTILVRARTAWSMPPDHGAAIVRLILEDHDLTNDWKDELETMQTRLMSLRLTLAASHPRLAPLARQTGMFSLLPLTRDQVVALRDDHGIYMADSGRINIAGLSVNTLAQLAQALTHYL